MDVAPSDMFRSITREIWPPFTKAGAGAQNGQAAAYVFRQAFHGVGSFVTAGDSAHSKYFIADWCQTMFRYKQVLFVSLELRNAVPYAQSR